MPLPLRLEPLASPAATELMSACYLLLMPYILLSCLRWWRRAPARLDLARRFHAGLLTLYAAGFLGYLLVPAAGPYLAMPDAFDAPLRGGWLTALNDAVVRAGSTRVDVFPSLHVAVSAYLLGFDARVEPARARRWALPVAGLWLSTLYLRYHYGVDVVAGLALAATALTLALRRHASPAPSHLTPS